jgi:hypothetical protein
LIAKTTRGYYAPAETATALLLVQFEEAMAIRKPRAEVKPEALGSG